MKLIVPFLSVLLLRSAALGGVNPVAGSLQSLVDSHVIAGAVTVVAGPDRVLDTGVVGLSDLSAHRAMTPDTLFWIASMSKPITATAVMMLVDDGRISVDDPVAKYLPSFGGQMVVAEKSPDRAVLRSPAHPVTIRDLLTHTSGLTFRTPLETHIDMLSLAQNVTSYPMLPLRFESGSAFEYSNAGMNTAARIVELVSKMPFEQFLKSRLFGPLGMKDTTFHPSPEQLSRLAKSYRPAAGGSGLDEIEIDQLSYPLSDPSRGICPAGGLFSTAADMAVFCRMILNGGILDGHRYISEASVHEMTSTQTGDIAIAAKAHFIGSPTYGYGFGWWTIRRNNGVDLAGSFQHGGAYNTLMRIDPNKKLVYVLMVSDASFLDDYQQTMWNAFFGAANALADPSGGPH